jgi:hypothetical protein
VQYDSGAISIRSYIEFEAARRFKSKPRRIHLLLAQDSTGPAELFPYLFLCEFQSETGSVMQAPAIHLHLMVRFQGKIQFFFNSDSKLLSCQCFDSKEGNARYMHLEDTAIRYCCNAALENSISWKLLSAQQGYLKTPRYTCLAHTQDVRKYNCIIKRHHWPYINFAVHRDYSSPGRTGSTSASPCAASARLPAIEALHQLRRASRLLVTRPHRLYVSLVVRREYSSPDHRGSTSTTPYAAATSSPGCTTTSTTISTSKLVENGFRGINN